MTNKVKKEIEKIKEDHWPDMDLKKWLNSLDGANWARISTSYALSEDFIREFQDKLDWVNISHHQDLSEDFMREMKHKIDWYWIYAPLHQNLSEDFIFDMWIFLNPLVFERHFINGYKITRERLAELIEKHKVESRYDLMEI